MDALLCSRPPLAIESFGILNPFSSEMHGIAPLVTRPLFRFGGVEGRAKAGDAHLVPQGPPAFQPWMDLTQWFLGEHFSFFVGWLLSGLGFTQLGLGLGLGQRPEP